MSKEKVFIDPSIVSPREITEAEMDTLDGAGLIALATVCSNSLVSLTVAGIVTIVDP